MQGSAKRARCRFRLGIADDIGKLEWHGAFSAHREIIRQAFAAQAAGEGLVLIADIGQFPVAQLWVRFAAGRLPRLWAFRVLPSYQAMGLGSRLLDFGEAELARRGFEACEVGAEKSNPAARQFYQNRGYAFAYEQIETFSYVTPAGQPCEGRADQWILRKSLSTAHGVIAAEDRGRAAHRPPDAWPANAHAARLSPACHNSPRGERAYSGRRNARRSVQARDRADKTESRS